MYFYISYWVTIANAKLFQCLEKARMCVQYISKYLPPSADLPVFDTTENQFSFMDEDFHDSVTG